VRKLEDSESVVKLRFQRNLLLYLLLGTLCILVFGGVALNMMAEETVSSTKEKYSLEARLLLNQLNEKKQLNSRTWDLNEWMVIHNRYLENYYNLLLEYDDEKLSSSVYAIELCLKNLYEMKEDGNSEMLDEISKRCNKFGREIEDRHYKLLVGKVSGVE